MALAPCSALIRCCYTENHFIGTFIQVQACLLQENHYSLLFWYHYFHANLFLLITRHNNIVRWMLFEMLPIWKPVTFCFHLETRLHQIKKEYSNQSVIKKQARKTRRWKNLRGRIGTCWMAPVITDCSFIRWQHNSKKQGRKHCGKKTLHRNWMFRSTHLVDGQKEESAVVL